MLHFLPEDVWGWKAESFSRSTCFDCDFVLVVEVGVIDSGSGVFGFEFEKNREIDVRVFSCFRMIYELIICGDRKECWIFCESNKI